MLLPEEAEYFKVASYSPSMDIYGVNSDHFTTVFEEVQTEMPLQETPSLTVSQKQLFTIHEISPEWGYAHKATKVSFYFSNFVVNFIILVSMIHNTIRNNRDYY